MAEENKKRKAGPELTTDRLHALVDGIFAFAMTLLVVNLDIPARLSKDEFSQALFGDWDNFYAYALSFLLLAVYWIAHHHQSHHIKKTDNRHIWITIMLLLFVALVPFSTSLITNYAEIEIAVIFFSGNLLALGLLFTASWYYAVYMNQLVDDPGKEKIISHLRRSLLGPAVSAIVMIAALFYPAESLYIYLALPLLMAIPYFRVKH